MGIKQNDFIEIEYTGKLKEEDVVFDTTDEQVAKDNEIHNPQTTYGSVIVCVGENQLLVGLDKDVIDKEQGDYEVLIDAEDGFGKKDAKLIQLIPTSKFKKEGIDPHPGLQINVDGMLGMIKTVSGGRTLVDFNHPLSGKELVYNYKIKRIVTDDNEKAESYMKISLGAIGFKDLKTKFENGKLVVESPTEVPDEVKEKLGEKLKEVIPAVKEIEYKKK